MTGRKMNGAAIILQALRDQGVDTIFGYPGGAILPFYDALALQNDVRHILVRHEQGAVHAAQGYSRVTGKVGVVVVTSGPGVTNAVTGLTDALMDSTPLVCFSGQVPTHLIGSDAFQECDATGMTRAATKHNMLVSRVENLSREIHRAFAIARSGRPGPVHIDIPKDVQFAEAVYLGPDEIEHRDLLRPVKRQPHLEGLQRIASLIAQAKKPVIYGGGGLCHAGEDACRDLAAIVKQLDLPITLTLMGLGAVPADMPQFLGMLGMHGTYEANMTMHDADLIVALGARFDDRVTGSIAHFSPHSTKVQIDIDLSSINKNIAVDVGVVGDLSLAIPQLRALLKNVKRNKGLDSWWASIQEWRQRKSLQFHQHGTVIKPQYAIQRLAALCEKDHKKNDRPILITTEVGQHQMWAAQHFPFYKPRQWVTSGGLGTMGFGLPAAIGMQLGVPNARVINIAGEASILMCIQEMSTAIQYRLPVIVFILNNEYMGMVRQWQDLLHGGRHSESYSSALPDFVKLAEAFGALGILVTKPDQLDTAIQRALDDPRPSIIDVRVDPKENCLPMIPSGAPHNQMILPDAPKQPKVSKKGAMLV